MFIDSFDLMDCQATKAGSLHPNLISMLHQTRATDDHLMRASLEYRPPLSSQDDGGRYDYKAELNISSPLKIVANTDVLRQVVAIFSSTEHLDEELTIEAATMYGEWKAQREREWREVLASRQEWNVVVEVTAPIFVFPEDCYRSDAAEVVFDMGQLSF